MPVTYGVDALRAVMLRGADLAASSGIDLAVLWGFLALFFALAAAQASARSGRMQGNGPGSCGETDARRARGFRPRNGETST